MKRTPLTRDVPLRAGGQLSRATGLESRRPLKSRTGMPSARITASRTGISPAAETGASPRTKNAAARKPGASSGEFSPKVKLQCRTRAGNGDPDNARCESCGCWLGRHGGQVQHRLARGSGGSSNPLVRSLANAALLCGTAQTLCHGDAESRDPDRDMEAKGFVIRHGNGPDFDPRYVSIMLASPFGSGVEVWLSETAPEYLFAQPEAVAA